MEALERKTAVSLLLIVTMATMTVLAGGASPSPAPDLLPDADEPLIMKRPPGEVPAGPTVSVRSRIEPMRERIPLGTPIRLYVDLVWSGEVDAVQPDAPEELVLHNLVKTKPMAQRTRIRPEAQSQTVAITYEYTLEGIGEGPASVEPVEVPYRVKGQSGTLRLRGDRFAMTILPRPWPWDRIALGFLGVLIAAAGAGLLYGALRRRARRIAAAPPSPLAALRADLEALREGDARDTCSAAERLVRRALAVRLGGDLRSATAAEIGARLDEARLENSARDRAMAVLDRCTRVKFSGYVPTVAERNEILAECRQLLDDLEPPHSGAFGLGQVGPTSGRADRPSHFGEER